MRLSTNFLLTALCFIHLARLSFSRLHSQPSTFGFDVKKLFGFDESDNSLREKYDEEKQKTDESESKTEWDDEVTAETNDELTAETNDELTAESEESKIKSNDGTKAETNFETKSETEDATKIETALETESNDKEKIESDDNPTIAIKTVSNETAPLTVDRLKKSHYKDMVLDRKRFDDLAAQLEEDADELVLTLRTNAAIVVTDFVRISKGLENQIRNKSSQLVKAIHLSAEELAAENVELATSMEQFHLENAKNNKAADETAAAVEEDT